jgi:hypothetical protein
VKDPVPETTPAPEGLLGAWTRFWFRPIDPVGLHTVRLLAGLLFLAWLLPLAGHVQDLYGLQGWFDRQAYDELARLPENPMQPLGWSILYPGGYYFPSYLSNPSQLTVIYWVSIAVVALFTLGVWPRLTGVLTWVVVASFTTSPAISYDGDVLLVILALYLAVGYLLLHQRTPGQSLAARLLGSTDNLFFGRLFGRPRPSIGANLALRLLQVHIAIVVFTSGMHKLQIGDWWSGVALWYPLFPPLQTTVTKIRSSVGDPALYLFILSVAAYAALAWQLAFPFFAWRPRWRPLLLGGAVVGWLATALVWHLPILGPAYLIGCLSFVSPTGWHRLLDRATRRLPAQAGATTARRGTADAAAAQTESPVALGHR